MNQKSSLTQKTKKELVVEILRDAIVSGELEPGERLLQEELAERFQVSPTPIREAIQQLVAEGVLSHSPYKGVQVAEVKLEDMQEVYLIRSVLEGLATKLAVPNLKISDVQHLHSLQADMETKAANGELAAMRKLNQEFHMLIYGAASAPELYKIIRNLWAKSPWDTLYVLPGRPMMAIEEHRLIMTAIDRGDAESAGQSMETHIERGIRVLADYLKASK